MKGSARVSLRGLPAFLTLLFLRGGTTVTVSSATVLLGFVSSDTTTRVLTEGKDSTKAGIKSNKMT